MAAAAAAAVVAACLAAGQELPPRRGTVVIGAGPAGIQVAQSLKRREADFIVLERAPHAGSFFDTYPVHRRLISINKRYTGVQHPEYRLRHDWNSLIGDPNARRFTNYTTDMYPHADLLRQYLNDFVAEHGLTGSISFNTTVLKVSKARGVFKLLTSRGTMHCDVLVVATGRTVPNIDKDPPGWELLTGYDALNDSEPHLFDNKTVAVLGGGNAGLETADWLEEHARYVHIITRSQPRFAYQTHYVGDIRAVRSRFVDRYLLKSEEALFSVGGGDEPNVDPAQLGLTDEQLQKMISGDSSCPSYEFTRTEDGRIKIAAVQNGVPLDLPPLREPYDAVIRCIGWRPDWDIFDPSAAPERTEDGRFPLITTAYESANVEGMFFAGQLAHGRDYRRSSGGFIHGFRYLANVLPDVIALRREQKPWPSQEIAGGAEELLAVVRERIRVASSMYQMFGYVGDVFFLPGENSCTIRHFTDVPLELLTSGNAAFGPDNLKYITLSMEWHPGFRGRGVVWHLHHENTPEAALPEVPSGVDEKHAKLFGGPRGHTPPVARKRKANDRIWSGHSNFLHPILRVWERTPDRLRDPKLVSYHHILEDVLTTFDHKLTMVEPLQKWLREEVAPMLKASSTTCVAEEASWGTVPPTAEARAEAARPERLERLIKELRMFTARGGALPGGHKPESLAAELLGGATEHHRTAFAALDTNGDGKITRVEVAAALRAEGEARDQLSPYPRFRDLMRVGTVRSVYEELAEGGRNQVERADGERILAGMDTSFDAAVFLQIRTAVCGTRRSGMMGFCGQVIRDEGPQTVLTQSFPGSLAVWEKLRPRHSDGPVHLRVGRSNTSVWVFDNLLPPDQLRRTLRRAHDQEYIFQCFNAVRAAGLEISDAFDEGHEMREFDYDSPVDYTPDGKRLLPKWPPSWRNGSELCFPGVQALFSRTNGVGPSYAREVIAAANGAAKRGGMPHFRIDRIEEDSSFWGLVSIDPEGLIPMQKCAHVDTNEHSDDDSKLVAMVHWLHERPKEIESLESGGTSFYREQRSGHERAIMDEKSLNCNPAVSVRCAIKAGSKEALARADRLPTYLTESTELDELLEVVPPKLNRLVVYPMSLLHSGFIDRATVDSWLDIDPFRGRLTGNLFGRVGWETVVAYRQHAHWHKAGEGSRG